MSHIRVCVKTLPLNAKLAYQVSNLMMNVLEHKQSRKKKNEIFLKYNCLQVFIYILYLQSSFLN